MTMYEVFSLLGGVGLFLYGMSTMSNGLGRAAGDKLREILEKVTSNKVMAVLVGVLVTVLIQSSSATDMMVIGFVNSGLMGLTQAIAVIMGANIGTTVTAQITAFNLAAWTPLILFIGVVMYTFLKNPRVRYIGMVILGFGMLFVGITMVKAAIAPLSQSPAFISFLDGLSNPFIAVLFGVAFTALLQSSSSSVVIFQAFAVQGILAFRDPVAADRIQFEIGDPLFLQRFFDSCCQAAAAGEDPAEVRGHIVHCAFFKRIDLDIPAGEQRLQLLEGQRRVDIRLDAVQQDLFLFGGAGPDEDHFDARVLFLHMSGDRRHRGKRARNIGNQLRVLAADQPHKSRTAGGDQKTAFGQLF